MSDQMTYDNPLDWIIAIGFIILMVIVLALAWHQSRDYR